MSFAHNQPVARWLTSCVSRQIVWSPATASHEPPTANRERYRYAFVGIDIRSWCSRRRIATALVIGRLGLLRGLQMLILTVIDMHEARRPTIT